MIYTEKVCNLFDVPKDYTLVHCISGDFALGAGIAVEFTKRGVKKELKDKYHSGVIGEALITTSTDWNCEVSLVTKNRFFEKPTLETLELALKSLYGYNSLKKIAMPKIGCGLDRLKWEDVSELIKKIFKNTDIEILVCFL